VHGEGTGSDGSCDEQGEADEANGEWEAERVGDGSQHATDHGRAQSGSEGG